MFTNSRTALSFLLLFVLAVSAAAPQFVHSQDLTEVTIVVPRSIEVLDDAHVHSGKAMGYFEEEGIDLNMEQAYGTTDVKMVATKQAEFAFPSPAVQLTAHENDLPIKSFFQVDVRNIWAYAVRPGSDIDSLKDLKGKKIALGAPAWSSLSNPNLRHAGLNPKEDVKYVNAGENRAQVVWEGKLDAVFTWEKEYQLWEAQGMDFKVIKASEVREVNSNSLVAHTDMLKNNRDLLKGFAKAFAKSSYFVKQNPEAATAITLEKFSSIKVDFPIAVKAVEALVHIDNDFVTKHIGYGYHDRVKWSQLVQDALKEGVISEPVALDEIFTNEIAPYANQFDREAVKEDAQNYELPEKYAEQM